MPARLLFSYNTINVGCVVIFHQFDDEKCDDVVVGAGNKNNNCWPQIKNRSEDSQILVSCEHALISQGSTFPRSIEAEIVTVATA